MKRLINRRASDELAMFLIMTTAFTVVAIIAMWRPEWMFYIVFGLFSIMLEVL